MLSSGCLELNKFAVRAFEREAMLVFAARRIRPQRRNADTVFTFDCLRIPGGRQTVGFRRHPSFDVPAVHGWIFWFQAQFHALPQQNAMLVTILEFPADPREPVPTPHGAIIRFAETIRSACARKTMRHGFRSVMRFADNSNHLATGRKSMVFTTNFWAPQSSTRSVTVAILVSTIASCSRSDDAHWSTVPGLSSRGPESSCTPMSGAIIGRRMATSCARSTRRKTNTSGSLLLRAEIPPHNKRANPPMVILRIEG